MKYRTLDSLINEAKNGGYVPEESENESFAETDWGMYRKNDQSTKNKMTYQKALQGYGYQTSKKVVFVETDDE